MESNSDMERATERNAIRPDSIAFIPPRFGPGVIGGAEAVLAEAAIGLACRGYNVEILTTCAKDHFTWANAFPSGVFPHRCDGTPIERGSVDVRPDGEQNGGDILVRRFAAETDTAGTLRDRTGNRILAGDRISIQDQQQWMNDSPAL